MRILIDNGHGKETPGKRSKKWADGSQLFEWKYTREIAAEVVKQLRAKGHDAVLLVTEETDVSLNDRCKRVNAVAKQVGPKNCLLVSIHVNASTEGKAQGWECHTYTGQSISDTYATVIWKEAEAILAKTVNKTMRGDLTDKDPDFDSNFAVLRDTICPSILTENLFMDNEKDCKFLLSDAGRKAIVDIHVQGILKIITLC
jgi:N-acetylmuramoyl-L-alanine amidase